MKIFALSILFVALALGTPAAFADKPSKPPGQDDKSEPATCIMYDMRATEEQSHGYLTTLPPGATLHVPVEVDLDGYGVVNQQLFIHENLLPPEGSADPYVIGLLKTGKGNPGTGLFGPYYGQIRVLASTTPYSRVDYSFDIGPGCVEDHTSPDRCRFHLVVADGNPVYIGKGKSRSLDSVLFLKGRALLYYRPCDPAVDPETCLIQLYGCYDERDCPGVPYPNGDGFVFATFAVAIDDAAEP